jgi:hypothetical protein
MSEQSLDTPYRVIAIRSDGNKAFTNAGLAKAVADAIKATLLGAFPCVQNIEDEPYMGPPTGRHSR